MITVDLGTLAEQAGVPSHQFTPPIPGAGPMTVYDWNGDTVRTAGAMLKQTYTAPGTELALLGHVDIWICLALAYAVEDTCKTFFASPNHDKENTFSYIPLEPLPIGKPARDVFFDYTIREEGSTVYLEYAVDDPKAQGHTFFHGDIGKLILPEVPAGKTLCIYGAGIYPVQWAVANTYRSRARSIFTACHQDKVYTCAWSDDPAYQVGDTIPRA